MKAFLSTLGTGLASGAGGALGNILGHALYKMAGVEGDSPAFQDRLGPSIVVPPISAEAAAEGRSMRQARASQVQLEKRRIELAYKQLEAQIQQGRREGTLAEGRLAMDRMRLDATIADLKARTRMLRAQGKLAESDAARRDLNLLQRAYRMLFGDSAAAPYTGQGGTTYAGP